jgi:hypothetical protein
VEVVSTMSRDPAAVPELNDLARDDAALALDEHRPGRMEWAILRPKKGEQP